MPVEIEGEMLYSGRWEDDGNGKGEREIVSSEDLLQLILISATLIMTILGWHVSKLNKADIVRLEDRLYTIRERSNFLYKRKVEIADEFLNCLDSGFESKIKLEAINLHNIELKKKLEVENDELLKETFNKVLDQNNYDITEEISALSKWTGKFRFYVARISYFDEFNDTEILPLANVFMENIRLFADCIIKELNYLDISNEISSHYYKIFKLITEKFEISAPQNLDR